MEIGSEFNFKFEDLVKTDNTIFKYLACYDSMFLNSGRSGLMILNHIIPDGKIMLPSYICHSVTNSFKDRDIIYYEINEDFSINIDDLKEKISKDVKTLLIMNYFGKLQKREIVDEIKALKEEREDLVIIEDTTHSIFTKALTVGDYGICSLRKWFPIPDGGVLYSKNKLPILEIDDNRNIEKIYGMILKTLFLEKDMDCNSLYRKIFSSCEEKFDNQDEPQKISELSRRILEQIDINVTGRARIENCHRLLEGINLEANSLPLLFDSNETPLTLPMYVEDRDKFREYLIGKQIYCAVHWPICNYEESALNISQKIISLPIDQRYGEGEIEYLVKVVNEFMEVKDEDSRM